MLRNTARVTVSALNTHRVSSTLMNAPATTSTTLDQPGAGIHAVKSAVVIDAEIETIAAPARLALSHRGHAYGTRIRDSDDESDDDHSDRTFLS